MSSDGTIELTRLIEELRTALARIDTFAMAAETIVDQRTWRAADRRSIAHLQHLLGEAARSATAAVQRADTQLAAILRGG